MDYMDALSALQVLDLTKPKTKLNERLISVLCRKLGVEEKRQPICCDGKGWSWNKTTGPSQVEEFYYLDVFHEDIEDFVTSYQLTAVIEKEDIENMLQLPPNQFVKKFESCSEVILDFEVYFYCWLEERETEDCRTLLAYYVAYGTLYILCRMEGVFMKRRYRDAWDSVSAELGLQGREYYDEIIRKTKTYTVIPKLRKKKYEKYYLSVILDEYFSFSCLPKSMVTPTLYMFFSASMAEYRFKIRERITDTALREALDKVVSYLEDPALMETCLPEAWNLADNEAVQGNMDRTDELSAIVYDGIYFKESYMAFYHFYDTEDTPVKFQEVFTLVRKLFDVLYAEAKRRLHNPNKESKSA